MKKLLAIILIVCFATMYGFAIADTIDLKSFSDDDIIALLQQVQQEIMDRKIEKSAELNPGKYVAGKDLPVGSYTLYCKYPEKYLWCTITITDKDGQKKDEYTVYEENNDLASIRGEGSWQITLEEGDVLECDYKITLTISIGVMFK